MTWDTFYLTCFFLGLALSLLAALSGMGHLHAGHFHLHLQGARGAGRGGNGVSAWNGFTLTAFLTWFGGAGYLLHTYSLLLAPLILLASAVSGALGAALIWFVMVRLLLPLERTMTPADTQMEGVLGRVTSAMDGRRTGEIVFSQDGARRAAAARSEDGQPVERGAEVVVMQYRRGVAYVRRWDEFSRLPGEMTAQQSRMGEDGERQ